MRRRPRRPVRSESAPIFPGREMTRRRRDRSKSEAPMDNRAGKVITFFSYKGGTGRSMALANVAWILASSGKRVLVVDWDLEAPGLQRFFHPFIEMELLDATDGVVDILMDYARAAIPQPDRPGDW